MVSFTTYGVLPSWSSPSSVSTEEPPPPQSLLGPEDLLLGLCRTETVGVREGVGVPWERQGHLFHWTSVRNTHEVRKPRNGTLHPSVPTTNDRKDTDPERPTPRHKHPSPTLPPGPRPQSHCRVIGGRRRSRGAMTDGPLCQVVNDEEIRGPRKSLEDFRSPPIRSLSSTGNVK